MRLSREPALLLIALVVPLVNAIVAVAVTSDPELAGAINAVAVALAGLGTAAWVQTDKLLPAITGLGQAVLAFIAGYVVVLSPEQQAAILAPIAILAGYIVRDRVTAPAPRGEVAAV